MFEFEELIADMLDISDEERNKDESIVEERFVEKFGIDFCDAKQFADALLRHTAPVKAGLSGEMFHAFVGKTQPVMLMRCKAVQ